MESQNFSPKEQQWLNSINKYIENIFCYAINKKHQISILADGFDIKSKEPVYWVHSDNRSVVISNFASQQNFLRLLTGMTLITDDSVYHDHAHKFTRDFLNHFVSPQSELFYWGGHRFINYDSLQPEGPANKEQVHELKNHLPYYDLLWEVDPAKTSNYIKALWNTHIVDWQTLNLSRHGDYNKEFDPNVFLHKQVDVVDPANWPDLPKTTGLTFINAGTDLIYAAYKYYQHTDNKYALSWAKHLYKQYVLARCPQTGMPVYQYSSPLQRMPDPHDDNKTESWYGDRAHRQFGPEFGEIAIEANVLFRDMSPMDMWPILMDNPLAMLSAMKKQRDDEVLEWVLSGLRNYYLKAYDNNTNTLRPMWGNGIDMTDYEIRRDGYYGKKGTIFKPFEFKPDYLLPLIQTWILTHDETLETLICQMLHNLALIECEGKLSQIKFVNVDAQKSSVYLILALIELNTQLQNKDIDVLLTNLADQLFIKHFHHDVFIDSKLHRYVRIDNVYPLALLAVIAYKRGIYSALSIPISRGGYLHGEYLINGKLETIYDVNYIYQQLID